MAKVVHALDLIASVRRSIRTDEAGLYTLVVSDADDLKGVAIELRESIVPAVVLIHSRLKEVAKKSLVHTTETGSREIIKLTAQLIIRDLNII